MNNKKLKKSDVETTVFISDTHIPFEDVEALDAVYKFIEEEQPENIVIIGDFLDFYEVSRYGKDPSREHTFQDEVNKGRSRLEMLRRKAPKSRIMYRKGNHEERLETYLMNNPELSSLDILNVDILLGLDDLDIEYFDYKDSLVIGKYTVIHGTDKEGAKLSGHSAYTPKGNVEKFGTSIIQGHSHRLGSHYKTDHDGTIREGHEIGYLSKPMDYAHHTNWQQGFGVLYTDTNSNTQNFYNIHIEDGEFIFNRKRYKGGIDGNR